MSQPGEIDPETLREEVTQIKDAMGLQERYPSQFTFWLVFGALVLIASLGSQLIVLRNLPGALHSLVWFGLMSGGGFYQWWATRNAEGSDSSTSATKPRVWVQFVAVFSMIFVIGLTVGPELQTTAAAESILMFSVTVALVGVAYIVVGESLRAYYIRRRDRWAFYLGGVWMLLLAVVMPNVGVLETWGYAVFGVAYATHAVGSYLALSN